MPVRFDPGELRAVEASVPLALFPVPDLAILLEVPAALGLERVRRRGKKIDVAFERLEYLESVAGVFAALDRPYLLRIDGAASIETVHARLVEELRARLGLPS